MIAISVKKLKARLSEYLRLVKRGEVVLVTDRDEVIAELRPARRQAVPADSLEEALDRLAAAGSVTRAAVSKGDWAWQAQGLSMATGTAEKIREELQQERGA